MKKMLGKPVISLRHKLRWVSGIQAGISFAAAILAWNIGEFSFLFGIVMILSLIGAAWMGLYLPKQMQAEQEEQAGVLRRDALRILSHYRHDVMNHIQLLKGYMQLKKYERLEKPIQNIILDAYRHSALSNLPGRELAYFLIEQDASSPMVNLHVELDPILYRCEANVEKKLIAALKEMFGIGERISQEQGSPMNWNLEIIRHDPGIAINLHVSGEHVNDTYIQSLKQALSANAFAWQESPGDDNESVLMLYNGKLGEIRCL